MRPTVFTYLGKPVRETVYDVCADQYVLLFEDRTAVRLSREALSEARDDLYVSMRLGMTPFRPGAMVSLRLPSSPPARPAAPVSASNRAVAQYGWGGGMQRHRPLRSNAYAQETL